MHKPKRNFRKVLAAGLAVTTALWSFSFLLVPVSAAVEVHPAGTLVLSGGTVWKISDDGTSRNGFDTPERFWSSRYSFDQVVPANSADLALPDGGLAPWGSGVLFNDNGTIFMVAGGVKRGFSSADAFTGQGFSFADAVAGDVSGVSAGANIDSATQAHPEGTFVLESGTVWYISATGRMGLSQPGVLFSHGGSFDTLVAANAADLALANEGLMNFRTGTLVNDNGTIWAVEGSTKRGFPSASCYTGFGFNFSAPIAGSVASYAQGADFCPAGDGDTTPPVSSTGTLTVSLASDTPIEGIAIKSAARHPFTKVNLTATGGDVTVDAWVVERTGVADDASFSSVDIVDLSNNATINPNAKTLNSAHLASFTDDLTVTNGTTKSVMLVGTIAAGAGSGEQPKLALNSITLKGSASKVGSFPIVGNKMTVNTSITLSTATVQRGAYTNSTNTTLEVGRQDYAMFSFQILAGTENLTFDQVKVYQQGSASLGTDLTDITLLRDGTEVVEGTVVDSNYVNFSFPAMTIPEGQTFQFQVQADVDDGSARTVDFGIWRDLDLHVVDQTYNAALTPVYSGTGTGPSAGPILSDNTHTISTGTLRLGRSSTVAATNITVGSNQVLGAFEFEAKGEPVNITALTMTVASTTSGTIIEDSLNSVRLVDENGATVAGPTDLTNNALTVAFTDTFTVPTGIHHYQVVGTMATNGGWASDDTITVSIQTPASAITARGETTGQTVSPTPSANISASQQTIKAATLTVTKNSTPTNKTVIANSTNVLAGSWQFDATNAGEDVRITSIAVKASTTSKFSNFVLKNGNTILDTNDNPVTSSDATATSTFALSTPLVVSKGTSAVVDLFVDVPSNAVAGEVDAYGITSGAALSAFGVATGNTATVTTVASDGALLTVAAAGTLTINLHADSPAIRQVVHGSSNVVLSEVDFETTDEDVDITKINVRVADGALTGTGAGTFAQVSKVFLKLDGVVVGNANGYSLGQANTQLNFSRGDITIPEGTAGAKLSVLGDIVAHGTNLPGTENVDVKVGLNGANGFTATGNQSNTDATITYNDSTGSAMILHRAVPSVVTEHPGGTLVSGATIHRAKVSAVGGTVGIYRMSYTAATSTGLDVDAAILKLNSCTSCGGVSNGSQLSATNDGAYFINGTFTYSMTVDNTQSHGKRYLAIASGSTATIDLVANTITGKTTDSDSVTTTLLGDTATTTNDLTGDPAAAFAVHNQGNFVWSPLHNDESQAASSLTSKQWYNGYYVSGLGATATSTSPQTISD